MPALLPRADVGRGYADDATCPPPREVLLSQTHADVGSIAANLRCNYSRAQHLQAALAFAVSLPLPTSRRNAIAIGVERVDGPIADAGDALPCVVQRVAI